MLPRPCQLGLELLFCTCKSAHQIAPVLFVRRSWSAYQSATQTFVGSFSAPSWYARGTMHPCLLPLCVPPSAPEGAHGEYYRQSPPAHTHSKSTVYPTLSGRSIERVVTPFFCLLSAPLPMCCLAVGGHNSHAAVQGAPRAAARGGMVQYSTVNHSAAQCRTVHYRAEQCNSGQYSPAPISCTSAWHHKSMAASPASLKL